jgi:uncharacterized membrane protein YkoI
MFRPALFALAALWAVPAAAQRDMRPPIEAADGQMLPFPRIAQIARAAAGGGSLIASDFDERERVYQLKFIRDGVVTLVYVDAKTGRVVGLEGG